MPTYKNEDANGDRTPHEILSLAIDNGMVQAVIGKVEAAGEDMLVVVCNLADKLGLAVASYNGDFDEQKAKAEGLDLWVYALPKESYAQIMRDHGSSDFTRMKPLEKQIVVYSAGRAHYFSAKGKYSGNNKGQHWAQFSKRDLH